MSQVTFRPLESGDMPLLHRWLNMPHMRQFYQKAEVSLGDVERKYLSRTLPDSPTRCHIAEVDGTPLGKIQCYRNRDYPDYASEIDVLDGTSIDLFIGEPSMIGRRLCAPMLRGYLPIVASLFPDESRIYICHDRRNVPAIACSKSVGFRYLRDVIEDGSPSVLLSIDAPSGVETV